MTSSVSPALTASAPTPPIQSQVNPWVYWPVATLGRLGLGFYFSQIEINGREHLPKQGPVVLAPKHFSRWDPPLIGSLYWEPMRYMTLMSEFAGAQGWLIRKLGAFPVNTDRPQVSSLRHARDLLRQGHILAIFPEGGIVRDERLRPLKPGLARLVLQAETDLAGTHIPIVPIAIRYSPDSVCGARVQVQICPPLWTQDFRTGDDKADSLSLTAALEQVLRAELVALEAQS